MTDASKHKMEKETGVRNFLEKVVVNIGVGRLSQNANFDEKILPQIAKDLASLAGQAPRVRRAKQSIAGFKLREGQIVGLQVTLRGKKMLDFFERLINTVLPRVRDFKGLDLAIIDKGGVLNIGIKEHVVFPEINPEESTLMFPLGVNLVPRIKNRENAILNYRKFGVPLKKS